MDLTPEQVAALKAKLTRQPVPQPETPAPAATPAPAESAEVESAPDKEAPKEFRDTVGVPRALTNLKSILFKMDGPAAMWQENAPAMKKGFEGVARVYGDMIAAFLEPEMMIKYIIRIMSDPELMKKMVIGDPDKIGASIKMGQSTLQVLNATPNEIAALVKQGGLESIFTTTQAGDTAAEFGMRFKSHLKTIEEKEKSALTEQYFSGVNDLTFKLLDRLAEYESRQKHPDVQVMNDIAQLQNFFADMVEGHNRELADINLAIEGLKKKIAAGKLGDYRGITLKDMPTGGVPDEMIAKLLKVIAEDNPEFQAQMDKYEAETGKKASTPPSPEEIEEFKSKHDALVSQALEALKGKSAEMIKFARSEMGNAQKYLKDKKSSIQYKTKTKASVQKLVEAFLRKEARIARFAAAVATEEAVDLDLFNEFCNGLATDLMLMKQMAESFVKDMDIVRADANEFIQLVNEVEKLFAQLETGSVS